MKSCNTVDDNRWCGSSGRFNESGGTKPEDVEKNAELLKQGKSIKF